MVSGYPSLLRSADCIALNKELISRYREHEHSSEEFRHTDHGGDSGVGRLAGELMCSQPSQAQVWSRRVK